MKNQTITDKKIIPSSSSSLSSEKKVWRQPQIMKLNVQDTKGGFVIQAYEGPFNFLLYS